MIRSYQLPEGTYLMTVRLNIRADTDLENRPGLADCRLGDYLDAATVLIGGANRSHPGVWVPITLHARVSMDLPGEIKVECTAGSSDDTGFAVASEGNASAIEMATLVPGT